MRAVILRANFTDMSFHPFEPILHWRQLKVQWIFWNWSYYRIGECARDRSDCEYVCHNSVTSSARLPVLPSASGSVAGAFTESAKQPKPRRSVFKGISNLSPIDDTPWKKYLMDLVMKKEDHIPKLKTNV